MRFINSFMDFFSNPSTPIALFKGFITLLTLLLVSTQQIITATIPIEQSAYEEKIAYEVATGKISPSFKEMKCDIEEEGYKNCALAKYKGELSGNFIDLLIQIHEMIYILAYIFGVLCVTSFISYLLLRRQVNENNS
ncbi:hypothetical protein MNZ22_03475 [Aeromonas encheleia]|uniref:hypothetical protein n=1 Tax=Aeromonas encheleia TaxID=73010 RepID=UPI001F568654|nr:hypothetical protein [Aeromonas encheleia]UNP89485.1 hypothetical protein MNZ22_03475 [Aeromonas encheleia]